MDKETYNQVNQDSVNIGCVHVTEESKNTALGGARMDKETYKQTRDWIDKTYTQAELDSVKSEIAALWDAINNKDDVSRVDPVNSLPWDVRYDMAVRLYNREKPGKRDVKEFMRIVGIEDWYEAFDSFMDHSLESVKVVSSIFNCKPFVKAMYESSQNKEVT